MPDPRDMTKASTDTFWTDITVPLNEDWAENGVEFINPVQVAEMFARATTIAAKLAQEAETLMHESADFEFRRTQCQRQLKRLRREVLAKNYKGITKSANAELMDAYFYSVLTEEERELLVSLEDESDEYTDEIGARQPRLELLRTRLKNIERNMDYMKQYLDYEKLQTRISSGGKF
jgi:hypothetical protein